MDAFAAVGSILQGLSMTSRLSSSNKTDKEKINMGAATASKPIKPPKPPKPSGLGVMSGLPASKPGMGGFGVMSGLPASKPPGMGVFGGLGGMGGMPPIKQGGLGGSKISASQILSGGMPCKFELTMEFFCSFFFTLSSSTCFLFASLSFKPAIFNKSSRSRKFGFFKYLHFYLSFHFWKLKLYLSLIHI